METRLRQAAIPPRYAECDFHTFDTSTNDRLGDYGVASSYVHNAEDHLSTGTGLLLWGPPGTGKTHLACATLRSILEDGYLGVYLTAEEYRRLSFMSLRRTSSERYRIFMQALEKRFDVVLIDDLGNERATNSGFAEEHLSVLLRTRADNLLSTLLCSQHDVPALARIYGESYFGSYVKRVNMIYGLQADPYV